jgi:hypothetical protein
MPTIYYNWDVPSDDDYVKDTAAYMRTLGNDIDATLWDINAGTGKVGLHLINKTNFTTAASVTLNNVFSNTYDAYKICASSSQSVYLRYRAAGVDSTGNYHQSGYVSYTPGSVLAFAGSNNSTNIQAFVANSGYRTSATIEVQNPYLAVSTAARTNHQYWDSSNFYSFTLNSLHLPSTQHDGFTIYPNASTISGTVSVYGYRLS